jgi:hypothetical protein
VDARGLQNHGGIRMDLDHAPAAAPGWNTAALGGVADTVKLK